MVVTGGSMEPTYHLGSAVLLDVSHRTPAVGDVVTFTSSNQVVVTHRVVSLHNNGGELYLQTKGDANPAPDKDLVNVKAVLGEPGWSAPWIGYATNFLTSPVGKLVTLGPILVLIAGREIWKGIASYRQAQAEARSVPDTLDWLV
jgi:signal peptidase